MKEIAKELHAVIILYTPMLKADETGYAAKPSPGKWSKKEILGHLIDSAQNNIRRFVVSQYEEKPHIVYAQDEWVKAGGYQQYNTADLIELWQLLNKHLCMV